jgi:hypothetical protein
LSQEAILSSTLNSKTGGGHTMDDEDKQNLIEVWKVLEMLTVSIDRIGHFQSVKGDAAGNDALLAFIGPDVARMIAQARRLAVNVLEKHIPTIHEELENLVENEVEMKYWNGPQQ